MASPASRKAPRADQSCRQKHAQAEPPHVLPHKPEVRSQIVSNIGNHAPKHDQVRARLDDDLALTKVHTLLGRRGVVVSYRTLHRFATAELGRNASISYMALLGRQLGVGSGGTR